MILTARKYGKDIQFVYLADDCTPRKNSGKGTIFIPGCVHAGFRWLKVAGQYVNSVLITRKE